MNINKKVCAAAVSAAMLVTVFSAMPVCAAVDGVEMTAVITLNGDSITAEGSNVTVEGTVATITASGSYEISGTLNAGQIRVAVPDETVDAETVKLYLNGATITGATDAAIYVVNAENTSLNLVAGTENYLYDGTTYTETTAVIYAKDDMTVKGEGSLTVTALTQQGIHCNNDLKINGGDIRIDTELEDALRGKTSVEINGGSLNINAEGDGIKSTQGDVFITGGVHEVKAGNDAVQGETSLTISGGELLANGDRSLTCATAAVTITGGTVLATATDNQPAAVTAAQPVMLLNFAAEQVKDQELTVYSAVVDAEEIVLSMKPDKKFSYALISAPLLTGDGSYNVALAGMYLTHAAAVSEIDFAMTNAMTAFDAVTPTDLAVSVSPVPEVQLGDVNADGLVKIDDAILLSRVVAEDTAAVVPEAGQAAMNVNQDDFVDAEDVTAILRMIAGLA
ncbi:MAG: carbohydrate-binding domain-containing protein [Ruminococcus sp.]|nr:carbohydrate-binding domain-containing protein [Ruminococcus sp.]